jgi:intraflagellar transport protein 80
LHTSGQTLIIKPLQPSTKPSQWKAHDSIILAVDWSQTVQLIISGGEDRKYKVWNSFGQLLYSSLLHDSPITSLSWSPAGDLFAVGGFNTLRLCDKAGWSHSLNKPQCGTIYKLAWSNDGTQMGGASGSGQIIMARVVERRMDWCHLEAVVTDENKITVRNSINDSKEYLVFSERIIKSSLSWDHLIVTTLTQCYIYSDPNWTTPLSFELKSGAVNLIKQSQRFFLLSEAFSGIQIASYEGRIVSTIKFPSDSVNQQTVAISNEIVIIRDNKEPNIIRFFDVSSGHEIGEPFKHVHEVEQVDISQSTVDRGSQKLLAFTDKNHDIFILDVKDKTRATGSVKIGSMVSSFAWNDSYNMLVGMADAQLMVWYLPSVVFTDQDLLPLTTIEIKGLINIIMTYSLFIG